MCHENLERNCSSMVGHGGSDGLHGYVPSLDHVVADTVSRTNFHFILNHAFLSQHLYTFIFVYDYLSDSL